MPKKKPHQSEFPGLFKEDGELSFQDPEEEVPAPVSAEEDELRKPQTVSELTDKLKRLIDESFGEVFVVGEISGFKRHSSGHYYFSLKDENALIDCAMFRFENRKLRFTPENGLLVVVRGRLDLYPPSGKYKIICKDMEPCGIGSKQLQLEQLKRKLEDEGLTSEARKRQLPAFPRTVGFVTSATGSVLRDVKNVLFRRFPCRLVFAPAKVQGEDAPASIIEAIENCNLYNETHPDTPIDVLIVGRGGGSMEDLWCFNDEGVARAIAASKIPVVSAVGHETDWTVADLVADLRAPTPSAAAELVVRPLEDWKYNVSDLGGRLDDGVREFLDDRAGEVKAYLKHYALRQPTHIVEMKMQEVDELDSKLQSQISLVLERQDNRLALLGEILEALGPMSVMKRGYAILQDKAGAVLATTEALRKAGRFTVTLSDGKVEAETRE